MSSKFLRMWLLIVFFQLNTLPKSVKSLLIYVMQQHYVKYILSFTYISRPLYRNHINLLNIWDLKNVTWNHHEIKARLHTWTICVGWTICEDILDGENIALSTWGLRLKYLRRLIFYIVMPFFIEFWSNFDLFNSRMLFGWIFDQATFWTVMCKLESPIWLSFLALICCNFPLKSI